MTLPYDPQVDYAVIVAPLLTAENVREGTQGRCDNCKATILINKTTRKFTNQHKLPVMCPSCGQQFLAERKD